MTQVRVREKHQVTLPMSIIREANISQNDVLEVAYRDGIITMSTHKAMPAKRDLMDFVGCCAGLYGKNRKAVDDYIDNERDSWER